MVSQSCRVYLPTFVKGSFSPLDHEQIIDPTRVDAGNQTDPKSIIEWSDVEDETRKLDSYSLKVRPVVSTDQAELTVMHSHSWRTI